MEVQQRTWPMSSHLDLMPGQFKEDGQQIVVACLKYLTYNLNPIHLGHHCPDIFITFLFTYLILRVIIAFITDITLHVLSFPTWSIVILLQNQRYIKIV